MRCAGCACVIESGLRIVVCSDGCCCQDVPVSRYAVDEQTARLLVAAGLPVTAAAHRRAQLPEGPRRLHDALLRAFVATGTVTDLAALVTAAGLDDAATSDLLQELAAADLVALDSDGSLTGAFPFSVRPTRHRVELGEGPAVWAMCAIDALGMPAMVGREASISSSDPISGTSVEVEVHGDDLRWSPDTAVVALGRSGDGSIATACCAHIDFYCDTAAAEQALASLNGTLVSVPTARRLGEAVFAGLFTPA
ncbi:MAG: organomercurial lyase [Acidimicrobiales bacterium]|jgi:hypothetical protein